MWASVVVVGFISATAIADFKEVSTNDRWEYTCYPLASRTLSFHVRASNDAHVILTNTPYPNVKSDLFHEVVLGGWGNTQSVVRKRRKEPSNVAVQTRGIVSAHEYRGFWIKLVGDAIVVGKESESIPIMSWRDPEPFNITHFGLATGFGSSGRWKIHENKVHDKLETPCMPDDVTPTHQWESDPFLLVRESCLQALSVHCQGNTISIPSSPSDKQHYADEY